MLLHGINKNFTELLAWLGFPYVWKIKPIPRTLLVISWNLYIDEMKHQVEQQSVQLQMNKIRKDVHNYKQLQLTIILTALEIRVTEVSWIYRLSISKSEESPLRNFQV